MRNKRRSKINMLTARNCHSKQNKKVKLMCSWPGTAIQNNEKSKINMFIAGNCHSKQKM